MNKKFWIASALSISILSCGDGEQRIPPKETPQENNQQNNEKPGIVVEPNMDGIDALRKELDQFKDLTAEDFVTMYDLQLPSGVSYTPREATNLDIIQASSHALNADQLDTLDQHGFVISSTDTFPSFVYGYESIYLQDLPLYISADSILNSVHRSYDEILKRIEVRELIPALISLLESLRGNIQAGDIDAFDTTVQSDTDFYLAVALGLLTGEQATGVGLADNAVISTWIDGATAATGYEEAVIFGKQRKVDFSQFKPRGHYTDSEELERYFRAMMWLGRIDLRILEPNDSNELVFHRNQLETAFALGSLFGDAETSRWNTIHETIGTFVGEPDNMILPELESLLEDLGVSSARDLERIGDDKIVAAIENGAYGTQRISSHFMVNGIYGTTKPLSSTFLIFGQRYILDSHVFSNVVFDRVQHGTQLRMMPDPLDVAFAALGNDHAGIMLQPQLQEYSYAPDLQSMRFLADRHGADYWNKNLYNLWMNSLRKLSPKPVAATQAEKPETATTEAWNRRMINAQLASWAELRHDTILYAKQSYTAGNSCEFPDAYVDPYPEFYGAIAEYAEHGEKLIDDLGFDMEELEGYFANLQSVANILKEMAEYQRAGTAFTPEMMAFVNQAVHIHLGCGDPADAEGWYPELFLTRLLGVNFDPTIADVHTQPTDEAGNPVGKVLHVGTGSPRLMVTTMDTCEGPKAYAGLVSSYYEVVTENFERLDDIQWSQQLGQGAPIEVDWMQDLVE